MTRKIIFVSFVVISLLTGTIGAQWTQTSILNKSVTSFAVNGSTVFAGTTESGIYCSSNDGLNWTQTGFNYSTNCIILNNAVLFTGVQDFGVYKSTNNGLNWSQTSLNNQYVLSLAASGSAIFAGTVLHGVFRSTNNGLNWSQTYLSYYNIEDLLIIDSVVLAGTSNHGIYYSSDFGASWTQVTTNLYITSLSKNSSYIYASECGHGVYRSSNNGLNWTTTPLGNIDVCVVEAMNSTILAGTTSSIYVSTNNGTNWTQKNEGIGNKIVISFGAAGGYALAGTNGNGAWRRPLSEIVGVRSISNEVPSSYALSQNYPNPFNPSTAIEFDIPKSCVASLTIYDITGREVESLVNELVPPGRYRVLWNAENYSSGVYFYTLKTESFQQTKRMVLVK